MNKNKLPIFELFYLPDESVKIEAISLVDEPATEANFLYFSSDVSNIQLSNDEEMIIKGPALIPNQLIYRRNLVKAKEGYIYFSKETIKQFAISFLSKNKEKINVNHSNKFINSDIVESYFVTDEKNEFDVPVGTWIVAMHINDRAIWNEIKEGKYKGFSIQGAFAEQLEQNFNKQLNLKSNMTLKEQLINAINTILFEESSDSEPAVSGETKPQEFAEEPIIEPTPSGSTEPIVEPVVEPTPSGDTEPIIDQVGPDLPVVEPITEDKIQELITKSQSETIDKLSKMIEDLNKKIDEFGGNPVPANKKVEEVDAPKSFSSPATRFVSRK